MNNLEHLNQLKLECQGLMPLVELMKNKAPANSLSGLERDQKLALMGFSPVQINEPESTASFLGQSSKESRLRSMGRGIFERMEAVNARLDQEFEQEYNRMLVYGMATGFVEDEPKLKINSYL